MERFALALRFFLKKFIDISGAGGVVLWTDGYRPRVKDEREMQDEKMAKLKGSV